MCARWTRSTLSLFSQNTRGGVYLDTVTVWNQQLPASFSVSSYKLLQLGFPPLYSGLSQCPAPAPTRLGCLCGQATRRRRRRAGLPACSRELSRTYYRISAASPMDAEWARAANAVAAGIQW